MRLIIALFLLVVFIGCEGPGGSNNGPQFSIDFSAELSDQPVDGRMLLVISNDDSREPRFQISNGPSTQLIFGVDVDQMRA